MADPSKPPKGWLIAALVFLLLALAGCGGGTLGCRSFVDDLRGAVTAGRAVDEGETARFRADGVIGAVFVSTGDMTCEATDDSGNSMRLRSPGRNTEGSFQNGGRSWDLRYVFDTQGGRSYEVTCTSPAGSGQFVVVPFPGFTGLFVGLGGIAGGVLAFIVAVICLIVGLVKRSGWRRRNPGGPPASSNGGFTPPPGGHPAAPPAPPLPGGGFTPSAPVPPGPGGGFPSSPPLQPPPLPGGPQPPSEGTI